MCLKVGKTRSGLVLVEMTPAEWQRLRRTGDDAPPAAQIQRVIGADLGWRDYRTSLALLDFTGNRPALLDTFQARTTPGDNDAWFARLGSVANQVDAWLQTALADGAPTGFAFEAVYLENNPATTIALATLGGLLAGLARSRGCPVARVYPVQARTALTGDSRAGKAAMQQAANRLFGREVDQHIADAAGIALHGEAMFRQSRATGGGGEVLGDVAL